MATTFITDASEISAITNLTSKLEHYRGKNAKKEQYYEGRTKLKNLGIALPDKFAGLNVCVGWAGTAVDVIAERINLEGFTAPDTIDIASIFNANNLDLEAGIAHLDSLIYGISYIVVGSGDTSIGEPKTLITIESPNSMVGHYNTRTRKLDAALKVIHHEGTPVEGTLYLSNETITFLYNDGYFVELSRDIHNLGIVPVVQLINRPRSSDLNGRSEITKTIMSLTDSAVRTFAGAELQRELYSSPGKYILAGNKNEFKDADGNAVRLDSLMSSMLVLGVNEEGNAPTVGQWTAGSPEPFIALIDTYIQQVSSETGIPASFLGYTTANPSSAEGLIASQDRMIKKAEDRTKSAGKAWIDVMKLAVLFQTGTLPEEINNIRPIWRNASTPSLSAVADAAQKMVAANIIQPNSEVLYTKLGFTEAEKEQLRKENKAALTGGLIQNLKTLADATKQANPTAANAQATDIGNTPA